MSALPAGGHGAGTDAVPELDDGDEAVSTRAVVLLRPRIAPRAEGGERPPLRRGERNRDAWLRVVEGLDDVTRQALEAIDLPPRSAPAAEVPLESRRRVGERLQLLLRRHARLHVVVG